jgi:hypothetical protein
MKDWIDHALAVSDPLERSHTRQDMNEVVISVKRKCVLEQVKLSSLQSRSLLAMDATERLLTLFRLCTALVRGRQASDEQGTGFFVAPGLLLTCAHVVKSSWLCADSVIVEWNGNSYSAAIQLYLDEQYADLALLKIEQIGAHPCVYLHEKVDLADRLYSYGYTDYYRNGDSATFENEGWTDHQQLLKLKGGEVRYGLSGAPILNLRTGGVCALVKSTRAVNTPLGGRAIPTSTIWQRFPELIEQQKSFHANDAAWQGSLSPTQIRLLGMPGVSGAVSCASPDSLEIFYLYAEVPEDRSLLERLDKHLAVMRRQGLISTWNKSQIKSGANVQHEINRHLEQAQIILFMISADFLAAYYLEDDTCFARALDRRTTGTRVIPVLLRPSDWQDTPFGKLMPLPLNGIPVSAWSSREEALYQIARGLRAVVNELRAS